MVVLGLGGPAVGGVARPCSAASAGGIQSTIVAGSTDGAAFANGAGSANGTGAADASDSAGGA